MFSKNEDIRDIQKTALSIFKEFRRICEENNLRFYTSGGTTIGALLYKGFIPFDDDIDINMPRPDYERFKQLAPAVLPRHLAVFDGLESTHADFHFLKLHDTRTMFTANLLLPYPDCYTGAFIDIEPIDGVPSNQEEREQWYFQIDKLYCYDLLRKFGKKYLYPDTIAWLYPNRLIRAIAYAWIQLHPLRYYAEKYEQLQRHYAEQYPFDESEYISYPRYGMYRTKSMWNTKRASWDSYIEIPFEDTTIRVPKGYENVLTNQYGFMPTWETQKRYEQDTDSHHITTALVDLVKPMHSYRTSKSLDRE